MLKRTAIFGLIAAALGLSAFAADKTVRISAADATWSTITFENRGGGACRAIVCGSTLYFQGDAGSPGPTSCHGVELPAGHALCTSAASIAASNGLPYWKSQEGL